VAALITELEKTVHLDRVFIPDFAPARLSSTTMDGLTSTASGKKLIPLAKSF